MDNAVRTKVVRIIRGLQSSPEEWVDLAKLGAPLEEAGLRYKDFGCGKLRTFLGKCGDALELSQQGTGGDGKSPVFCVRPKQGTPPAPKSAPKAKNPPPPPPKPEPVKRTESPPPAAKPAEKDPARDSDLFSWAWISPLQIKKLSETALAEKWYYGSTPPADAGDLPILRNYLIYTFKKLCSEEKIRMESDLLRSEEYAAFNTGLVDRKYEYIHALFKQNKDARKPQYWYLVDFVVAGEDTGGKTLVNLFNPLPEKANYFSGRVENMFYDASTGRLSCDYTHILTEHTERLPLDFLKENCPELACLDGVTIDDVYHRDACDPQKTAYFRKVGKRIGADDKLFNRLKKHLDNAIEMALKKVVWNYKTALPMYYSKRDTMLLLLPLALTDDEQVDLALVVERTQSGAYLGHTVLPLAWAYSNSRLVTRPDSDWLRTEAIVPTHPGEPDF